MEEKKYFKVHEMNDNVISIEDDTFVILAKVVVCGEIRHYLIDEDGRPAFYKSNVDVFSKEEPSINFDDGKNFLKIFSFVNNDGERKAFVCHNYKNNFIVVEVSQDEIYQDIKNTVNVGDLMAKKIGDEVTLIAL